MDNKFYLLIAGSRSFNNFSLLARVCDKFIQRKASNKEIIIIEGGAKGTDSLAKRYARERKYECVEFSAEWDKFGKTAGFRRNKEMHDYINSYPNRACICFWDGKSKGTAHNFDLARKNETPLLIYNFINEEITYYKGRD